jgi:hypothetical protein
MLKGGEGEADMKDLMLVGVTIAFFAIGWVYAKSFDRL